MTVELENAISTLLKAVTEPKYLDSADAMRYTQAVLNLTHAVLSYQTINNNKPD